MHYIVEPTLIEDGEQSFASLVKECLVCLIFSEKPYLADTLPLIAPDEDIVALLRICRFLSAVLEDKEPDFDLLNWNSSFEGRYHSVVAVAIRAASQWRHQHR